VTLEQPEPAHRLLVRRLLPPGHAVAIVHFLRAVEAEPHAESLGSQKAAPLLVEENPISLDAIGNAAPGGPMPVLDGYQLAEEIQAGDSRLAAVPGKADYGTRRRFHVLDNIGLQEIIGHADCPVHRIETLRLQVVAVATVQVAERAHGFGKYLEFSGSDSQESISCSLLRRSFESYLDPFPRENQIAKLP
jgi:hypothetical protein